MAIQKTIRVFIVSDHDDKRTALRAMLQTEGVAVVGDSRGGPSALDKVDGLAPDVVLITFGWDDRETLTMAERIYLYRPGCAVLLVAEEADQKLLEAAMRSGVRSVLSWPVEKEVLLDTVRNAYRIETTRAAASPEINLNARSKVITVFGTKGGIGKTTIAVNLAVRLAAMKFKVALIDLDLQFGDCSVFLDLDPKETIAELVQEKTTFEMEGIRSYMTTHHTGVSVLPAPRSPEYAEAVHPDHIVHLLTVMRPYFDYIIVDTAPAFNECSLTAIEASVFVIYVAALDVSTLFNAKVSMDLMESLQLKEKVRPIINRMTDSILSVKDAEQVMGCPVVARIPVDWKCATNAINKGIPVVLDAPRSKMTEALVALAKLVSEDFGGGREKKDKTVSGRGKAG
jgi:pilus assembly protein CpaE